MKYYKSKPFYKIPTSRRKYIISKNISCQSFNCFKYKQYLRIWTVRLCLFTLRSHNYSVRSLNKWFSSMFTEHLSAFFPHVKNLHTRKTSNGSTFGWLIWQMSINQKSGRQTFRRRFVSGSLFVLPCPPECYFQSETKIEPDLRLHYIWDRYVYTSKIVSAMP